MLSNAAAANVTIRAALGIIQRYDRICYETIVSHPHMVDINNYVFDPIEELLGIGWVGRTLPENGNVEINLQALTMDAQEDGYTVEFLTAVTLVHEFQHSLAWAPGMTGGIVTEAPAYAAEANFSARVARFNSVNARMARDYLAHHVYARPEYWEAAQAYLTPQATAISKNA